jgi:hypothetical protein
MANGVSKRAEAWEELLAATRQALSTLRAEELEELASRAEKMLEETAPTTTAQAGLKAEQRLLGDLLSATDRNLQVLRRLCARKNASLAAEEGHRAWAR